MKTSQRNPLNQGWQSLDKRVLNVWRWRPQSIFVEKRRRVTIYLPAKTRSPKRNIFCTKTMNQRAKMDTRNFCVSVKKSARALKTKAIYSFLSVETRSVWNGSHRPCRQSDDGISNHRDMKWSDFVRKLTFWESEGSHGSVDAQQAPCNSPCNKSL